MAENIQEIVPTALYTTLEVMSFFRLKSRSTLYYWERDKKLVPRRFCGRPRYLGSDILKLVESDSIS